MYTLIKQLVATEMMALFYLFFDLPGLTIHETYD